MKTFCRAAALAVILCALAQVANRNRSAAADMAIDRGSAIRGSLGTYDGEPRGKDGRVDIPRLISELVDIRANTYHWLINHAATDWDDLQRFLPMARKNRIRVWVCLAPPRSLRHVRSIIPNLSDWITSPPWKIGARGSRQAGA